MRKEYILNKCRGSIVGGAVGDALGYPVEFDNSFVGIRAKYGDNGIEEYDMSYPWHRGKYDKALFSDDTQMTLYTAEGLLEAERVGKPIIAMICNAYLAWYGGQTDRKIKIAYDSELARIEELNQQRAPGNTCLSALFSIYNGKEPMNVSKGCGGVMRVAPIGLYGASHEWPLEKTSRIAGEAAELTHLHPMSTYSSAMLAVLCQQCASISDIVTAGVFKEYVEQALEVVTEVYGEESPAMSEFKGLIRKAVQFEDSPMCDWEVIENCLGGGWIAEETLAIAIFSVLRHIDDFKSCVISAVNHGGDSDSTGSVAGNIIGAILGYDAIPPYFKDNLQRLDLLIDMADKLSMA